MRKTDARQLPKTSQETKRLLAIEYWKKHGNMVETAKVIGVSYGAVRKWVSRYQQGGISSLKQDGRGRPTGKELNPQQENIIIKSITDKNPEQLKLPFGLWTRENVGNLINQKFGIKRSVWQIGRYLKEWGFTPQKPVYKAYEQNSMEIKKWLNEIYPSIQNYAKRTGAMIFWGDETGVRSRDVRGRSFSPKGNTPVIRKTGKQFGINMISAVNNRGKLYFMIYRKGMNAETFIEFLKRLTKSRKEKLILIIDNLPAHKTLKVKDWVKSKNKKIQICYLPAYAPELNPDEYLNQDLKVSITGKINMSTLDEMERGVVDFMNKRKSSPKQVKKYFNHPKVRYAS